MKTVDLKKAAEIENLEIMERRTPRRICTSNYRTGARDWFNVTINGDIIFYYTEDMRNGRLHKGLERQMKVMTRLENILVKAFNPAFA